MGFFNLVNICYCFCFFFCKNFVDFVLWNKIFVVICLGVEEGGFVFYGWGYVLICKKVGYFGCENSVVYFVWREIVFFVVFMEVIFVRWIVV